MAEGAFKNETFPPRPASVRDGRRGRTHTCPYSGRPEACDASFLQAEDFFDDPYAVFDCESWLLSPVLAELLDERNRIIQFQKRFQITRVDREARQAEEKVFGKSAKIKALIPKTQASRGL